MPPAVPAPVRVWRPVRPDIWRTASSTSAYLRYRQPSAASIDGNSVEMDAERSRFADNAVRYEASLRLLNGQIKSILSAITG